MDLEKIDKRCKSTKLNGTKRNSDKKLHRIV